MALWAVLLLGVLLTAFYTARLVLLAFFGSPRMTKEQAHHIHESPAVMTVPLGVLAILTAVAGIVGVPSSHGTAFERFLAPVLPLKAGEHGGVARARPRGRVGHHGLGRRVRRLAHVRAGSGRREDRSASPPIPSTG